MGIDSKPGASRIGAGGRCQLKSADVASLRMLRRARDRIDRDYAEQIDIPALAAGAGYSREHFIRAFRTTYGETPGRYRTRTRNCCCWTRCTPCSTRKARSRSAP